MIHVHYWKTLSAAERSSWIEPFKAGARVGDFVGDLVGPRTVMRNGEACELDDEVSDYDHLSVVPMPGTPVAVLVNIAISAVIGYGISLLIPSPDPPVQRDDDRSANRGFNSMSNTRAEGQPIEVLYGEHRIAGTILSEFVRVNNDTLISTYFALVSVGHGPIESIAGETSDTPAGTPLSTDAGTMPTGIQIQGNPAPNYSGIKAWVRLGSDDPEPVPGFERAYRTVEVGAVLEQEQVGVNTRVIPEVSFDSDAYEEVWNEWAFGWDTLRRDVDRVDVILNFPRGLYRIDSGTSDIQTAGVVVQVRFCLLDSDGNPLLGPGRGGNQNDGWVRMVQKTITKSEQTPFQISMPIPLYEPQDYQAGDPGGAMRIDTWTAGTYLRTQFALDSTRRPAIWAPSIVGHNYINRFSFEGWFTFDTTTSEGPFGSFSGGDRYVALMEYSSAYTVLAATTVGNGLWVGFRVTPDGKWHPRVDFGHRGVAAEWPDVSNAIERTTVASDKKWHHIVFSYKFLYGLQATQEFFINGTTYGAIFTPHAGLLCPNVDGYGFNGVADARILIGHGSTIRTPDYALRGWIDEVIIWNKALTYTDVNFRYNSGRGQLQDAEDGAVLNVWHGNGDFLDAAGVNDLEIIGSSGLLSVGTDDGVVEKVFAPLGTTGKYRVQVLRVNGLEPDSTLATAERRQDEVEFDLAVTSIAESYVYPRIAYFALEIPATGQLNTRAPSLTSVAKGRKVPIWDGESTIAPTAPEAWTANPAWIMGDIATNPIYGGGQVFSLAKLDLVALKAVADACDARVYDRKGGRHFYRQEFEANSNLIAARSEAFGFWTGNLDVTANTEVAPDGETTADKLEDNSTASGVLATESITAIGITASEEPTWYCYSLFVLKQPGAPFSSSIQATVGGVDYSCSFSVSDGEAVSGCVVEDYSDTWWLVKMDTFFSIGGSGVGAIAPSIYPCRYTLGTTVEDGALIGEITVWGAFLHRGRVHLDYLTDVSPRCYLYMADENASGSAQTLPSHWTVGRELRLRGCSDADWDTPAGVVKALEILEVQTFDDIDGYTRVWVITAEWYSELTTTHPSSTFPNLITGTREWEDPLGDFAEQSGDTLTTEFDDGGTTGGPLHPSPLQANVLKHTTDSALGNSWQVISSTTGDTLVFRAKAYRPAGVDSLILILRDGAASGQDDANAASDADNWVTLTATTLTSTSSPQMEFAYIDATADAEFYIGSVGVWVSSKVTTGASPGGTVEGAEALFRYDAVHDTFRQFWDALIEVSRSCRAMPGREGGRLRFKQDGVRLPVGLLTMGSIEREPGGDSTLKFSYTGGLLRENYLTTDIQDRDHNWERKPVVVTTDTLDDLADPEVIIQGNFSLPGVTRRSQALRHGEYMLRVNELSNVEGSLRASPGKISYEPGDVVAFGHDMLPLGKGGRTSRQSTTALNLLITDNESFTAWTFTSSYVTVTANVVAGPTGIPNGHLIAVDDALQGPVQMTSIELGDGVSYMFSIRVKKKTGVKIGFSLSQEASGTQLGVFEYTWSTGVLAQISVASGITSGVIVEANGWVRVYLDYESKAAVGLKMIIIPERDIPSYDGARVYVADAMLELAPATGLPSTYDRPGAGIWLDRKIELEPGTSYTARITNKTTGNCETCNVTAGDGEFLEGDLLAVDTTALTFTIEEGDEYLIYSDAQRFESTITSLALSHDGAVDVEFLKYDEGVFVGDDATS